MKRKARGDKDLERVENKFSRFWRAKTLDGTRV